MKRILLLILISIIFSCSKNEKSISEKYLNLKWRDGEKLVFEEGNIHSYTHFDIDLNEMVGDSLIPIEIRDSTIVVTKIKAKGKYEEINGRYKFKTESDTIYTDTLIFECRNYNGPKLLLYSRKGFDISVFNLDESENQEISEIIYFNNIRFEVGGYSIGDTIDRKDFNFNDVHNYEIFSYEDAELKENKNIDVNIIGDKYILEIVQRGINESELDDVIKVVSTKLNQDPKHIPLKGKEYDQEYYMWNKNGVGISLQKSNYLGDDPWRKIYSNNDWILYYEDEIIESLLVNEFKYGQPKSSIIK